MLCCVCGVLGDLAPDHRCAYSVCCVACAVSLATWFLFTNVPAPCAVCPVTLAAWCLITGVPARCVVLRVRCPCPLGSCSPVCTLGVLCLVCGVLAHLAPLQRCACWVEVVSRVRCPSPLGLLSLVCPLRVLCWVWGVVGHLAPVHRCARSLCCVACAVCFATLLLCTVVPARSVVLGVGCDWPLGSWSTVCTLGVLCCVCGFLGHLAFFHLCGRSLCCVACAVSLTTWPVFTGVPAWCVVLVLHCPCPLVSCSPVCMLGVL